MDVRFCSNQFLFFSRQSRSEFKFIISQIQYLTYQDKVKRKSKPKCSYLTILSIIKFCKSGGNYLGRSIIWSITASQLSKIPFNTDNTSPSKKKKEDIFMSFLQLNLSVHQNIQSKLVTSEGNCWFCLTVISQQSQCLYRWSYF